MAHHCELHIRSQPDLSVPRFDAVSRTARIIADTFVQVVRSLCYLSANRRQLHPFFARVDANEYRLVVIWGYLVIGDSRNSDQALVPASLSPTGARQLSPYGLASRDRRATGGDCHR